MHVHAATHAMQKNADESWEYRQTVFECRITRRRLFEYV